jgi:DNA-binding beta-propeller fold protein YncE
VSNETNLSNVKAPTVQLQSNDLGEELFVTKWGTYGTEDGQFNFPWGIAIDSIGYVYITDIGWNSELNHRIQIFDSNGNFLKKWGSYGKGNGQFDMPHGIAVNLTGFIYVVDHNNNRIQVFDANGNFLTKWGATGPGDGQFDHPSGIAIGPTGKIYTTDRYNNRIQVFDTNGNFLTKWGSTGPGDGQFDVPNMIAIDSSGRIYVTDTGNHRIQVFDANGNFITKWGSYGSGINQFNHPIGITISSDGYIFVADTVNRRIQVLNLDGTFITRWGSEGSENGQFIGQAGVAVNSTGFVYVTDCNNNRVQVFKSPLVAEKGLVGCWNFNEGTGNTVYDNSGNRNHGAIHGAAWTTGISGSALEFDGIDDYVELTDPISLSNTGFTIEFFICLNSISEFGVLHVTDGSNGWGIWVGVNDFVFEYWPRPDDWPNGRLGGGQKISSVGVWKHIVMVYNDHLHQFLMYGDTILEQKWDIDLVMSDCTQPFEMGSPFQPPSFSLDFLHGLIDEVRIYNRSLSAEEILTHFELITEPSHSQTPSFDGLTEIALFIFGLASISVVGYFIWRQKQPKKRYPREEIPRPRFSRSKPGDED